MHDNKDEELEPIAVKPVEADPTKAKTDKLRATALDDKNSMSVTKEMLKREKMFMLKLASTPTEKFAQFVSINGVSYMIPRDVWVKVPESVIATLDESKIRNYSVMADPKMGDQAKVESSEVSRFSYQSRPVEEPATTKGK